MMLHSLGHFVGTPSAAIRENIKPQEKVTYDRQQQPRRKETIQSQSATWKEASRCSTGIYRKSQGAKPKGCSRAIGSTIQVWKETGVTMTNKKMGPGQNRKLKADHARDKTDDRTPEEKREVARRQGSSKKIRGRKG